MRINNLTTQINHNTYAYFYPKIQTPIKNASQLDTSVSTLEFYPEVTYNSKSHLSSIKISITSLESIIKNFLSYLTLRCMLTRLAQEK